MVMLKQESWAIGSYEVLGVSYFDQCHVSRKATCSFYLIPTFRKRLCIGYLNVCVTGCVPSANSTSCPFSSSVLSAGELTDRGSDASRVLSCSVSQRLHARLTWMKMEINKHTPTIGTKKIKTLFRPLISVVSETLSPTNVHDPTTSFLWAEVSPAGRSKLLLNEARVDSLNSGKPVAYMFCRTALPRASPMAPPL